MPTEPATPNVIDQAQLIAEGLDIDTSTYTGRERDAIVAMTLVSGYRRMEPDDQAELLYRIDGMHMGGAFVAQCRGALAMMIANPVWVPGSLTNAEVEDEIDLWRGVSKVLATMGFSGGLGTFAAGKGKSIFRAITSGKPALKGALSPGNLAIVSASVMGYAAQSIAQQAIADLSAEATRRGQLGTMTPLTAARYGQAK